MDVFELQAKIGLNTRNFIDGVKTAISAGSNLKQNVENQAQAITKQQTAIDTLKNKLDVAKSATASASDKVATLTDEFNRSVRETGAASEETKELASTLSKAENELKRCQRAEEQLNSALEDLAKEADDAEEESKELGDATKKAGDRATESSGKFEKFGNSLKNVASTAGKVVSAVAKISAVAVGAAAAGLTALTKQALDASASYEQLKGGVETLFGAGGMDLQEYADSVGKSVDAVRGHYEKLMSAQDKVMQNSYNAFKTAGMSSNQYMETVTSFSASLLQSVAGDTNIAADIADMAIRDMSDNANKMGTDMQSIQNAYQGFAKQNYTMLDNLKLGYGGTKTEMERLLADAEKLSGQTYSIDSLMDVYNAIHVVQEQMGITGTTAKEAAGTIEGSVGSMKAAWENLVTAFGSSDMPIDTFSKNFVDSVSAAASNVIPRIGQIIGSIGAVLPDMIGSLFENIKTTVEENDLGNTLLDGIDALVTNAETVLETAISSIFDGNNLTNLIERAAGTIGTIGDSIWDIFKTGLEVLPEKIPEILSIFSGIVGDIIDTITEDLPNVTDAFTQIIENIAGSISTMFDGERLANLIPVAIQSMIDIATAIADNFPVVIRAVMDAIPKVADAIISNLDDIINAGSEIITSLVEGMLNGDSSLIDGAVNVVMALVDAITNNIDDILIAVDKLVMTILDELLKPETLENIISAGTTMFIKLVEGLASATGSLLGFSYEFTNHLAEFLLNYDWLGLGLSIVEGIADGILKIEGVQEAVDGFAEIWAAGYIAIEEFINNVAGLWQSGWDTLQEFGGKVYDAIESFKTSWAEFWGNILQTLTTKAEDFKNKIQAIPDKFMELVNGAKTWGSDMIQGFIDGIQQKWAAFTDKIKGLAQTVADYLHFSVPAKGPLSDFDKSAPDMIDLFAKGIRDNAYKIGNEFNNALDLDTDLGTATVGFEANSAYNGSNNAQNAPYGDPMYVGANDSSELFGLLNAILAAIREGKQIVLDTETVNSGLGRVQTNDERSVLV